MAREAVLEVKNLSIAFKTPNGLVKAVRDVSFDLYKGETLAIVGESGSGKSVTNRAIMGILARNGVIENGEILFQNQDLAKLSEANFHKIRGRKIGMIFQDPLSSLNPTMRIGKQITEAMLVNGDRIKNRERDLFHHEYHDYLNQKTRIELLKKELEVKLYELENDQELSRDEIKAKKAEEKSRVHSQIAELKAGLPELKRIYKEKEKEAKEIVKKEVAELKAKRDQFDSKEEYDRQFRVTKQEAHDRAIEIMTEVGIPEPEKRFNQYPFQFSGGMRQRIVIAIALAANPELLICDEPTTALDVTIQGQILNLIKSIKKYHDLSIIFITHDLGVVANMADRVAVMYAGKIVEYGTSEEIFYDSRHPYTWALLSSVPDLDTTDKLLSIPGTPPDMLFPPKGDAFADRNKYALKIDFEKQPPYFKVSDTHFAATWLLHPDAPKIEMPKIIRDRVSKYDKDGNLNSEKGDVK